MSIAKKKIITHSKLYVFDMLRAVFRAVQQMIKNICKPENQGQSGSLVRLIANEEQNSMIAALFNY